MAWIRECTEKHSDCQNEDETLLPSRVIDVGTSDGHEIPCLRPCSEERGHYVTLSHCWGLSNPTSTTTACYQDYLKGIPLASLPRTYRDAIAVTRGLGIRYLWIDSLCIIQDSSEDWEKECIKMPQIYQNSTVTIAGPAASGCESGFLDRQSQPAFSELPLGGGIGSVQVHSGGRQYLNVVSVPELDSPLSKRAWILQERLLSRRVLYFGSRQMYWECLTNVRYEKLHYPKVEHFLDRGEVEKRSFGSARPKALWLDYWYSIVTTYSAKNLTFSSDKLPALSGVAGKIQGLLGYCYVAGLWKEDLVRGLTWARSKMLDATPPSSPPIELSEYRAPSWSWACQEGTIFFVFRNMIGTEILEEPDILDVKIQLRGRDPFGEIRSGHLRLHGKVRVETIRKLP
jgi:Heterokaryon incompatibility protein (HET)